MFAVIELMRSNLAGSNVAVMLYLSIKVGWGYLFLMLLFRGIFLFLSKKCYVIASGWLCLKQNIVRKQEKWSF